MCVLAAYLLLLSLHLPFLGFPGWRFVNWSICRKKGAWLQYYNSGESQIWNAKNTVENQMLALVCISWIFHCFFLSYFICPIQIMTSLTVPASILWESHVLVIWRPPYVLLVVVRMFYRRRQWHPTPVLWPGKSHRWRSLVGCSPWGR